MSHNGHIGQADRAAASTGDPWYCMRRVPGMVCVCRVWRHTWSIHGHSTTSTCTKWHVIAYGGYSGRPLSRSHLSPTMFSNNKDCIVGRTYLVHIPWPRWNIFWLEKWILIETHDFPQGFIALKYILSLPSKWCSHTSLNMLGWGTIYWNTYGVPCKTTLWSHNYLEYISILQNSKWMAKIHHVWAYLDHK